ncbi:hypothetical protein IFM51744_07212 [Aspergillus udagawae]|nr:hypothetical protein IFM51744_07212 [Aspergillus udagawae]
MAAFYLFPCLPTELRARIWELTVEPRTVEVRGKRMLGSWRKVLHVTSSTPVPAVLQACHEARNLRLYQQAFIFSSAVERRYVWVNFDIDMISIGDTDFDILEPAEQLLIRQLTIQRKNTFFIFESYELFSNLEEMHIICEDGLMAWQDAWENLPWPCPKKNLRFIDKETGQIALAHVVDFACGTGLVTFLAETQVGPTGVYQRGYAGGDGTGQFDLITYAAVLVLLPDPLAAIRRWASLLREGGRLVTDMAARDVHVACADV